MELSYKEVETDFDNYCNSKLYPNLNSEIVAEFSSETYRKLHLELRSDIRSELYWQLCLETNEVL